MATITATLTPGFRVRLDNGRHQWFADEPLDMGGDDTAPGAYELLLGSLAACTAVTLRMYAQHKGFALGAVTLAYRYEKADAGGAIERITSVVTIAGDYTDEQRVRLRQIAMRCPIHRTLTSGVAIVDEVIFATSGGTR